MVAEPIEVEAGAGSGSHVTELGRTIPSWPRVSVIIPTLNEAQNLPHVLTRLPTWLHEVILVDGRSTDNTIEVARALYPDIRVVHQTGRGKGDALAAGFAGATGDVIVMLDADGSADPDEIPRFITALLTGADFAKGSRFLPGGGSSDITRFRTLGNRGLNFLVNVLYRTRYTDLCYGYNAFWRYCLPFMDVNCDGFEVETLINVRIAKARLQVAEVPSFERSRIHGVSNLNAFTDGWRVLKTILKERITPRRLPDADSVPTLLPVASDQLLAAETASELQTLSVEPVNPVSA
jgi:glycosyltransferase involved in cell wall biosynthesis